MVAFWLMPASDEAAFFNSLVARVAAEHDAPVFESHLTLYAGRLQTERAVKLLHSIECPQRYDLQVERVGSSDKFTKTLFVQFRVAPELQLLSKSISETVNSERSYELNPHLSLLYKELPPEKKAELVGTIRIPFQHITFDRLQVISGNDQTATRSDVESWRPFAVRDLKRASQNS